MNELDDEQKRDVGFTQGRAGRGRLCDIIRGTESETDGGDEGQMRVGAEKGGIGCSNGTVRGGEKVARFVVCRTHPLSPLPFMKKLNHLCQKRRTAK